MSFFNNLVDWFNNFVIKSTYNPAEEAKTQTYRNSVASNLSQLQGTVGNIGGGLGTAIQSIPGVGGPVRTAFVSLKKESEALLESAKSMTPGQIAAANESLKQKAEALHAEAAAQGISVEKLEENQGKQEPLTISSFFASIFKNTLYICIFFLILFLALLGSSLAANAAINKPLAYRVYYMIYGFILFPISIILGIKNYMAKKQLFYSLWAPLHTSFSSNKIFNILLFPFIYTPPGGAISHFSSVSLVQTPNKLATMPTMPSIPIMPNAMPTMPSYKTFDPNAVGTIV